MRFKLFIAMLAVVAGVALLPASATASEVGGGVGPCTEGVYTPTYNGTSVRVQFVVQCPNYFNIQVEGCTQRNYGTGWFDSAGTCYTTPYKYVGGWDVYDYYVTSYCGSWYRGAEWVYMNGQAYPWFYGNANYRC
jgi:hypothetical protein